MKTSDVSQAMFMDSLPVNPRPFVSGLAERLANGIDIQSDECKRILWMLNSMAYGQLATIDMCEEYARLEDAWLLEGTRNE